MNLFYRFASSLDRLLRPLRHHDRRHQRRRSTDPGNPGRNGSRLKGSYGPGLPQWTLDDIKAELYKAGRESRQTFVQVLRMLAAASDSIDPYTHGHSERVTRFSAEISDILDLPKDEIERIRLGALIHDIGKITIDPGLLNKPTTLTEAEYAVMKTHTTRGYELLKDLPELADVTPAMRYHHERLDGNGYPHGLAGTEIPMIARIVMVADCFDAMTTARPYQSPAPFEHVLATIRSGAGIKYDERVVDALHEGIRNGRIMIRSCDSRMTNGE